MKLALVFGLQQGNALKPRLQGIKDNLNIDCFDSVPLFIDTALKRNSIYDRILVLNNSCIGRGATDAQFLELVYEAGLVVAAGMLCVTFGSSYLGIVKLLSAVYGGSMLVS